MKVFIRESIEAERISIQMEEGGMVANRKTEQIEKGYLNDVSEVTSFDEKNKNIRFSDNSTLIKIPNNKIIISGDNVKKTSKAKGGCGGCAKKRKRLEERERRAKNGS
tara:strand:+ start:15 stop:338 length:324 start_codon:yes stop_codon:yes gene_type:complete